MRLWGHQFLYDREELIKSLNTAGFNTIEMVDHKKSDIECLNNLECRPWHNELIVEAK
jgi:hypothetical protein